MLTFASLLLGLTLGIHEIELLAEADIASVEIVLDGTSLGRIAGPPFRLACDFGPELAPRKLEAVGYASDGTELARAVQWVNLPRQPAEITAIFERPGGRGQDARARLRWAALAGNREPEARAWLDGTELEVTNPEEIILPRFDPEQLHFFRAELTFPGNVVSSFEAPLGGTYTENVRTELTAVALTSSRRREPTVAELDGALSKGGIPLEVVAIDKPPARIVVVRDRSVDSVLATVEGRRLLEHQGRFGRQPRAPTGSDPTSRLDRALAKGISDWRLEFLWPVAARRTGSAGQKFDLFSHSPELGPEDGSLYAFLTRIDFPVHLTGPQRLADSLAVAGLSAAAVGGRRAALLILGNGGEDSSGLRAEVVQRYLRELQVPLEVWTTERTRATPWGEAVRILPKARLDAAWRSLLVSVDRQRIAWVRGRHLPRSIELAPIEGLDLVR